MVVHSAVNRRVVGSSPTSAAFTGIKWIKKDGIVALAF